MVRARVLLILVGLGGCAPPGGAGDGADAAGAGPDAGRVGVDGARPDARPVGPDAVVVREPLVLATANIRCLVDDWDARLPLLADAIASLGPDVLALQEVCQDPVEGRDGLTELVDAIRARGGPAYETTRAVTHRAWDRYDEGIALASRWPLEQVQEIALPRGTFPRKAVIARVVAPSGTLRFAATHLSFGNNNAAVRQQQLAEVRTSLYEARTGAEPLVIAGDLNESPAGSAIAEVLGAGFADAWATVHSDAGGETVPSDSPTERIDYVLLRDPPTIVDAGRFLDAPRQGVWPSDHRGVWCAIEAF